MRLWVSVSAALLFSFAYAEAATNLVSPVQTYTCAAHTWASSLALATGATTCTQPAYSDLSGASTLDAQLANLITIGLATSTQTIFGPQPNLSAQAAATLANTITLKTPSTPIKTTQPAGATNYSLQMTGNSIQGGAGSVGTGTAFTVGYNATNNKQIYFGDFDGVGSVSYYCLRMAISSSVSVIVDGIRCDGGLPENLSVGNISATTIVSGSPVQIKGGGTVSLYSPSDAVLHYGNVDAATAVAQTIGFQGIVAGTTNVAGANATIAGSVGTGTGAGGNLIFQVAPAGSTGSAQNPELTALTIAPSAAVTLTTIAGKVDLTGLSLAGQTDILCYNTTGGVVSYDTTVALCTGSDEDTKFGMRPVSEQHSLDLIMGSKPISFYFKPEAHEGKDYHFGFGAQTLARTAPELVLRDTIGKPNAVRTAELTPITWAAMQQMQHEIENLRVDNDNLRHAVELLRAR